MSEISAPDYKMTNPAWYWLYNYKNQCWDKAETGLDGSVTVYQWDKELKRYTRKIYFKEVSFAFYHTPTENDFAYWYGIPNGIDSLSRHDFINPNKEKDSSYMGLVWKWNGTEWSRIDETSINPATKTYIICHGLNNSYTQAWIREMAEELAKRNPNAQILCVDWGDESKHATLAGDVTASNIDEAAARAAIFLSQVLGTYSMEYTLENLGARDEDSAVNGKTDVNLGSFAKNITWIGHSFGAHMGAWFSEFIGRSIGTIVGLDSAEEEAWLAPQKNTIILQDFNIADNVFFYKSSKIWGGEENLGHYSFIVTQEGITYISGDTNINHTGLGFRDHGYAYEFYTSSMDKESGSSAGYPLTIQFNGDGANINNFDNYDATYYSDLTSLLKAWKKTPIVDTGWIGVIDDASGRIEGLTQGYAKWRQYDGKDVSWDYINYKNLIEYISKNVSGAGASWFPSFGKKLDPRILAVKYLTDYSFCDETGQESKVEIIGKDVQENVDKSYKLSTGSKYEIETTVYNYADNIAFGKNGKDTLDAQEDLHSTWELWLSSNGDKLDRDKSVMLTSADLKIYPTNLETVAGKTTKAASGSLSKTDKAGEKEVKEKFSISEEQLAQLLEHDSALKAKYDNNEEITLYLYQRAGVDSEKKSGDYVVGELFKDDNESEGTKITVQKGVNVTFVIDVSGSMDGEIEALKKAMTRYIEKISDTGKEAKMRLITFRGYPGTESVVLTTTSADEMLRAVSNLYASGGISPGEISLHALETAVEIADQGSKIIMVTDEEAYPGANSHNLMSLAAEKNIQISTSVVGYFPSMYSDVGAFSLARDTSASATSAALGSFTQEAAGDENIQTLSETDTDDTKDGAVEALPDQEISGEVGSVYDSHYGYYYDDYDDWYKIDLETGNLYCFDFQTDGSYVTLNLYDSDGETAQAILDSEEKFTFYPVESGTYYLRVSDTYSYRWNTVSYSFNIKQIDSVGELTEATVNQTVTGTVHRGDDYCDWIKVDLEEFRLYNFNIQSENGGVFMNLYEGDAETEVALLESGEGFTLSPDASGTYYMRVRAADYTDTSYTLNIKQIAGESELGTSLESFSIIAAETGGNFVSMPYANYYNKHQHEALYYNFLMSVDNPVVMTCGPDSVPCGTTVTLSVNGSGTNWRSGHTNVSFSSEDIIVKAVEVTSPTSLQVKVEVAEDCVLDTYDVSVTCGNEVAEGFGVLSIGFQPSNEQIVSVSSSCFERGKDFVVTIHGYMTSWTQDNVEVSLGTDINVSEYEVISNTEIKVYGTVSEEANLGYRTVSVLTGSSWLSCYSALFVTSTTLDAPTIAQITPDALVAGVTTEITITGKNLDFATSTLNIDFGQGIEILETTVVDATTLKMKISVDKNAATGFRDVRVDIDGRVSVIHNALDIAEYVEELPPRITHITPDTLEAGSTTVITIIGENVDFTTSTPIIDMGEGIEILETTAENATTLKVRVCVDKALTPGYRDVRLLIDNHESVVWKGVNINEYSEKLPPSIALISPNSLEAGSTTVITITGENVDFTSSTTAIDMGEGIEILETIVENATTLKVKVSVGKSVTVGLRDVCVRIDGQDSIIQNGLDIGLYNDVLASAISLPFASDNRAYRMDSLGVADPQDYFLITPSGDCAYRVALESSELTQQVMLSVGTKAEDGSYAPIRTIVVDSDAAVEEINGLALAGEQDYYISVQATGVGEKVVQTSYTLRVDPCSTSVVSDDNTADSANKLTWGISEDPVSRGWVGYGDALDIYSFELEDSADIRVSVNELSSAARMTLYKQNAEGGLTQVSTNSVRSNGLDRTLSLTSGTYFVELASYDAGAGRYNTTYALELEKKTEGEDSRFAIASV